MTTDQILCPRPIHRAATIEQLDRLDEVIEKHNHGKSPEVPGNPGMSRWVEIAVTGRLSEYYTLWHITQGRNGYNTTYVKNISKDIEGLIRFIEECDFPCRLSVVATPTVNNGFRSSINGVPTMPIGKYRGALLEDIFKNDPQYILWFAKTFKTDKNGFRTMRMNERDLAVLNQARALVELFWKEKTEANRQNCKSEYIGTLKVRMQHSGRVIFCKEYVGDYGEESSFKVDLVDENGNLFYIYSKKAMEKDTVFSFVGTPTQHREFVGRKKTYFNRISPL